MPSMVAMFTADITSMVWAEPHGAWGEEEGTMKVALRRPLELMNGYGKLASPLKDQKPVIHGSCMTLADTASPEPVPLPDGPSGEPHQLLVALITYAGSEW